MSSPRKKFSRKSTIIINVIFWSFASLIAIAIIDGGSTYYDYDFASPTYYHPVLDDENAPDYIKPIISKSFDALLGSCPGLHAALSRGEHVGVYYYPKKLGGKSDVKDVSFMIEADIAPQVFDNFPKGLHDPQWGNHIMYRFDLVNKLVWMDWPPAIWLCHLSLFGSDSRDADFIMRYERTWQQQNVSLSLPSLPDLPPALAASASGQHATRHQAARN